MKLRTLSAAVVLTTIPLISAAQITNHVTEGNLAPSQDLGCVAFADVDPGDSAADLALAVSRCLSEGRFDSAAETYVAMLLFGQFDVRRVADPSAHGAVQAMAMNLSGVLSPQDMDRFATALEALGDNIAWHDAACADAADMGPPTYFPMYMVAHGMAPIVRPGVQPLVENFDAGAAWDEVLTDFFLCGAE